SSEAALAYFRGERVSAKPNLIDLGEGEAGTSRTSPVELVNRTDAPIRIIGGSSDCSCVTTDDLPISIGPNESRSLTVRVRFVGPPGIFSRTFVLFTEDQSLGVIGLRLTGRITEHNQEGQAAPSE